MKILPAPLVQNLAEFQRQVDLAVTYTDEIDVDIVNWQRTAAKTITAEQALSIPVSLMLNFDLMMDDPEAAILKVVADPRVKNIIVNWECKQDLKAMFSLIKQHHKKAGLSLNPNNNAEEVTEYFPYLDLIQIYTVEPGAQGNPFLPARLELLNILRKLGFSGLLESDGGFNSETAVMFRNYPLDLISVGSALSRSKDPKKTFQELSALVN